MLKVDSLHFGFSKKNILSSVSFPLKGGETLQLKGSNGCGKTTLCKILAGLLKGYKGEIQWQNLADKKKDSKDLKPFVSYLASETNGLFLELSAFENMNYWLRLKGLRKSKEELLTLLEQGKVAPRYFLETLAVRKFSTGMKRRLALLRSFSLEAPLVVLDEPTSGLDQSGLQLFRKLLQKHTENHGMAVIVSHDLDISQMVPTQFLDLSSPNPQKGVL